jgi:hypothetical protein
MAAAYRENPSAGRALEAMISDMIDKVLPAVAKDAKRYAPVLTGYLRAKISYERVGPGGIVYADTEYAAAVENGYVHHGSGTHIAAQPYLRPAVYKHRSELS